MRRAERNHTAMAYYQRWEKDLSGGGAYQNHYWPDCNGDEADVSWIFAPFILLFGSMFKLPVFRNLVGFLTEPPVFLAIGMLLATFAVLFRIIGEMLCCRGDMVTIRNAPPYRAMSSSSPSTAATGIGQGRAFNPRCPRAGGFSTPPRSPTTMPSSRRESSRQASRRRKKRCMTLLPGVSSASSCQTEVIRPPR